MTSLSIRSSNAIKSSPGKSTKQSDNGIYAWQQYSVPTAHKNIRFFSKNHLMRIKDNIRNPEIILIFVTSLAVFYGLLAFRLFDDNKLTSWYWVLGNANLSLVTCALIVGLLASLIFIDISMTKFKSVALLIVISFMMSMSHWGNPEVILDAARYFTQAKYFEIYGAEYFLGQWGKEIMAWTDLPLVPFIYGLVFKVFGENRVWIQIVNMLFFTGTVFVTYCLGKLIWNHRVGLYGAILLLAVPYLHVQTSLMMVDVSAMFFLMLAVYLFASAITGDGKYIGIMAAFGITLALLSKYTNWIMLSVLPVILYIYYRKTSNQEEKKRILRRSKHILFILSGFIIVILSWGYDIIRQQIGMLISYQLPIINGWTESYISTFIFQSHPAVVLAASLSIYLSYRKRDIKIIIISWMIILIIAMGIERTRYLMIVYPMLALMGAYAIANINSQQIRRYMTLSILVTACTVSILGNAIFLQTSSAKNIHEAGEFINELMYSNVEVILLEQVASTVNPVVSIPLFDLATQKTVKISDLYTKDRNGLSQQQKTSTLRFTWEFEIPEYYEKANWNEKNIIAVISSEESQQQPVEVKDRLSGYYRVKRFNKNEGIFRYKTIVDIYLPTTRST